MKNIIDKLQKAISYHETIIKEVEDIKVIAKKFHGKVMNKKFIDALTSQNSKLFGSYEKNAYVTNTNKHELTIYTNNVPYQSNNLLHIWDCERDILDGNRLSADKLIEYIERVQSSHQKSILKIKQDIETGFNRLREWNNMAKHMNELLMSMSTEFKEQVRNQFEYIQK